MTEELKDMLDGEGSVMDIEMVSNSIYKITCTLEDLEKMGTGHTEKKTMSL